MTMEKQKLTEYCLSVVKVMRSCDWTLWMISKNLVHKEKNFNHKIAWGVGLQISPSPCYLTLPVFNKKLPSVERKATT